MESPLFLLAFLTDSYRYDTPRGAISASGSLQTDCRMMLGVSAMGIIPLLILFAFPDNTDRNCSNPWYRETAFIERLPSTIPNRLSRNYNRQYEEYIVAGGIHRGSKTSLPPVLLLLH